MLRVQVRILKSLQEFKIMFLLFISALIGGFVGCFFYAKLEDIVDQFKDK